jgi:hypothetical protein
MSRERPDLCDACGEAPRRGLRLLWDDDPVLAVQRGWLCWRCNDALRAAASGDDREALRRLALLVAYLGRGGGPAHPDVEPDDPPLIF